MASVIAPAVVLATTAGAQRVSLGWAWQNPAPLGRVARGVVRAGSFEYTIGDDGTLLRSSDGGADWSVLDTGIDEPVSRLEVVDEATLVIGDASGCGTEISTNAGKTFASIFHASPRCLPVAALSFVSPSVGFTLLRDGAVERTVDGGRSFSAAAPLPGSPAEIGMKDEKHFLESEGLGTELHFRTASSGIAFVTSSYGQSAAYATSDGGASWSPITLPAKSHVESVDFVSEETAYAAGPETLLYSSDAGATWQELAQAPASLGLTAYTVGSQPTEHVGQLPLCVVGEQLPSQIVTGGPVYRSSSESASLLLGEASEACSPQTARPEIEYNRLLQGPGELLYAPVGNGYLALSSDEGRVWRTIATPSSELTDASFVDPRKGITLDGHGVVHETEDGGASWRTLATGTKGAPRAVAMVDSRSVLALAASGIRRSNGSGPFAAVGGRAASAPHLFGFDVAGSTVFAYGARVLLRSTDAGARWTALRLPSRQGEDTIRIQDISFVSPTRGYVLDDAALMPTLWSTHDAGRHWRQVISAGQSEATSVHFVNAEDGYLAGTGYPTGEDDDAYILHTSDGGATWSPEYVGPGWLSSAVVGAGADAAVVLQEPSTGVGATMFYTTSSFGEAGPEHAHLEIRASPRTISGRELIAGHGSVHVTVSGTLSTGAAGQSVIVAERSVERPYWYSRLIKTGPGGHFTTRWLIGKSSVFVAQWLGDPGQTGAGSRPLTITTPSR